MMKQLFIKLALTARRLGNPARSGRNAGLAALCCLFLLWLQSGQARAQATQDVGHVWVAEPGLVTAGAVATPRGGATDPAGNTYMVGNYFETVDFDPGPGVTPLTAGATGLCLHPEAG